MPTIELLTPTLSEEPVAETGTVATRNGSGGDIVLVDNGKPHARLLLQLIAERVVATTPYDNAVVLEKGAASRILQADEVADLATTYAAAITGLGDCGACSACSLSDALLLEAAGVPSTVVISDVFSAHVASFAASLGFPGYHHVAVPHPVSSRERGELERFADQVSPLVVAQLTASTQVLTTARRTAGQG
jgi:hypothetical protein